MQKKTSTFNRNGKNTSNEINQEGSLNTGGTEKLRTFSLTMIVVGFVIGMGIFRTATDAAQASATPVIFFYSMDSRRICSLLWCADLCGDRQPLSGHRRIL